MTDDLSRSKVEEIYSNRSEEECNRNHMQNSFSLKTIHVTHRSHRDSLRLRVLLESDMRALMAIIKPGWVTSSDTVSENTQKDSKGVD